MEIKVLGIGCPNCQALEREVYNALAELGIAASVQKVKELEEITKYGVFATPALVINGKVKAAGRVPSRAELKRIIQQEATG